MLKYFLVSQLLVWEKLYQTGCFFCFPDLFLKEMYDLRNFGRFSLSLQPPVSLEAGKSFWCQGCQSPGRWQKCRVLAGLISCLFQVPFFKKMLCWYTYIHLVGTFPSKHQINWQQLYKKATSFGGDRLSFFWGAAFFVATLFWCCDLPRKNQLDLGLSGLYKKVPYDSLQGIGSTIMSF